MEINSDPGPNVSSVSTVTTNVSRRRKWCGSYSVTVEPILLLFLFAVSFTDSIITNLIEQRICELGNYTTPSNCSDPLGPDLEKEIQPKAARIIMAKTIIEAFLPAILSFFIGPWSDCNGRKPFLLSSVAGYAASHLIWAVLSQIKTLPPVFFLLASVPISFTGGFVAIFTCTFCYLGDITTEKNRGFRMALAQTNVMFGLLLGYLLLPNVYKRAGSYGTLAAFLIACFANILNFVYTAFFLPESLNNNSNTRKPLFDVSHVKEMLKTITAKRPNHGRTIIFLLVVNCCLAIVALQGEMTIRYLSLREKFSWTLDDFNNFAAFSSCIFVAASVFGLCLIKRFDVFVILVLNALNILSESLMALSTSGTFFIIAANISCFSQLNGPAYRNELAKIVSKTELGKAFAFLSSLEAMAPLIGSPMYTALYSAVASFDVYFLSVAIFSVNLFNAMIIMSIKKVCGDTYHLLIEEAETTPAGETSKSITTE